MLRIIGAPAAIFGYLLHLLLPITTALAYDIGARGDILEICTIAGVKRVPLTLEEAQGRALAANHQPAQPAPDGSDDGGDGPPAQHPSYCPGSAPAADIPPLVLFPPSTGFVQGPAALIPGQPVLAGSDPAAGPSPRGPPSLV